MKALLMKDLYVFWRRMKLFVLMIVVNRVIGEEGGGVFTLAFSHAQLMYYLATLEVRPIQSTDVNQKYRFADYFSLRTVSSAFMILASLGYVLITDGDPFKRRIHQQTIQRQRAIILVA